MTLRELAVTATCIACAVALSGCRMREGEALGPPADAGTAAARAPHSAPPPSARPRPMFVHAKEGAAADVVRAEVAAAGSGREVLVYVGATWCEPCQRFHEALERGELDEAFPRLTLVEFDADADRPRLAQAGYASQYIPLFAAPLPDGRASPRRIEGSVKGVGAVAQLTPRLRALLAP